MPATVEIYIGKIYFKTNERKERKRKNQREVAGNVFVLVSDFGDVFVSLNHGIEVIKIQEILKTFMGYKNQPSF